MRDFLRWLASRWIELALLVVLELLVGVALLGAGTRPALTALVCLSIAAIAAAAGGVGLLRARAAIRASREILRAQHPLDVAAQGPNNSASPEARAAAEALETVAAAAQAQFAGQLAAAQAQRDYTEAWVHEVKTPLAAAKLAVQNNPGPGAARIAGELDRVEQYVDQALFVARSNAVDRDLFVRELDAREVVAAAVRERRRALYDAGFEVSVEGVAPGSRVLGDEKWLVFMLGQIIDNAVKYRASAGAPQPRLDFALGREGEGARAVAVLSVADNGLGIAAADAPRVFDRGFTGAHGRADGSKATGIGLYLVRELATKMGLAVRLQSAEGEGTRVDLLFPDAGARA